MDLKNISNSSYVSRIEAGVETLTSSSNKDSSIVQRMQMWSATSKAISEKPLLGYNITERFNAIEQYLPDSFPTRYSHPHNDILAGTVGTGLLGGLAAFISLISVLFASLLNSKMPGKSFC